MKASQFIKAKGITNENEDLIKYAEAIEGTEQDIEFMTKEAGPLMSALMTGGKALMRNNVVRNAVIGTGVGAITGAAKAEQGQRLGGAVKGGLIGAALGGGATAGKNIYKNMRPAMGPGTNFSTAVKLQGKALADTGRSVSKAFQMGKARAAVASGNLPAVPIPEPSVPEPSVPNASIPEPSVPKPSVPNQMKDIQSEQRPISYATTPIHPEDLKSPELFNIPPATRSNIKNYASLEQAGINVENLKAQGQNVDEMRKLVNQSNPIQSPRQLNSRYLPSTKEKEPGILSRIFPRIFR